MPLKAGEIYWGCGINLSRAASIFLPVLMGSSALDAQLAACGNPGGRTKRSTGSSII
jgi:hypothetical protein